MINSSPSGSHATYFGPRGAEARRAGNSLGFGGADMFKVVVLSVFTTLLITSGQVLWKVGLARIGGFYQSEHGIFGNLHRILTNPHVIAGFLVYIVATGCFMFLLSKYEISLVIPISSVSFVFSLIAGACIFHEHIGMLRVAGVLVIIAGILMVLKN